MQAQYARLPAWERIATKWAGFVVTSSLVLMMTSLMEVSPPFGFPLDPYLSPEQIVALGHQIKGAMVGAWTTVCAHFWFVKYDEREYTDGA